ncbi:MAG: SOS response-associated peptidase [Bacillota bacterium]
MCSRYFLDADGNIIAYTFRVPPNPGVRPRYNIAPTQEAPVIRRAKSEDRERGVERELAFLRWGLVPFFAKDPSVGNKMINARAETVAEKPAFREALAKRRCLVPASGFYEWKGAPGRKQPFAITFPKEPIFAFAGLWERWKAKDGDPIDTFTIVTTDASPAVAGIHDRMPVILPREAHEAWLSGEPAEAAKLLKTYTDPTNVRAVKKLVSDPRNDGPECLEDEPGWDSQRDLF